MTQKCLKYSLIPVLIFLFAFKGGVCANSCGQIKSQQKEILQSNFLTDAKGAIESVPEVCNGSSFQYTIFKLKKQFGNNSSFSAKQNITETLIEYLNISSAQIAKIPCYLFYCRILL
jgi:hypothetical protein